MLRGLATLAQRGSAKRPVILRNSRGEAMARRQDISIAKMNELTQYSTPAISVIERIGEESYSQNFWMV